MNNESVLLPYRLRTVRAGVWATYLVLSGLVLYPWLPTRAPVNTVPYLILIGIAAAGVSVVAVLPWKRMFEHGIGMWLMYAWSVLDVVLITAIVAVTGGQSSDLFWIYTLTTFFMAAAYPPRGQVAVLLFTYVCYLGVLVVIGDPILAGDVVGRFIILAALTFMASFLFRELSKQMAAHNEARAESERRADVLGVVARAARRMSTLDSEEVLTSVIRSAVGLGFDAAMLGIYSDDGDTYRVACAHGYPVDFANRPHRADRGMAARLLAERETIVIDNYSDLPDANPALAGEGFRSGILTPVWVQGRLTAALSVANRRATAISAQEIEAMELLATQAGRALENARLFEEERRTVERFAQLDELKQDFLSNVSHELRTPLTAIEGMGVTLEERWEALGEERRREFVRRMNANARALHDVITTLLDFSKLESGNLEIQAHRVDLHRFTLDIGNRLASLFNNGLKIHAERGMCVNADPHLLERVLENLLSNAAKHTPEGTPVELSCRREGDHAVISVADEGPGIPPNELEHLGERFFRGGDTNTRKTRGTGLGLAFTREVLHLHGSALEISSEVGKGSRFSFRLPVKSSRLPWIGQSARSNGTDPEEKESPSPIEQDGAAASGKG